MLTGKKIGAIVFAVISLVFLVLINFHVARADDTSFQQSYFDSAISEYQKAGSVPGTYNLDSNYYAITNGTYYLIYHRGTPDVPGQTRNASQDTLIGVGNGPKDSFNALDNPITNDAANFQNQQNTVNNIAKNDYGDSTDVWTAVQSKNSSYQNVNPAQKQILSDKDLLQQMQTSVQNDDGQYSQEDVDAQQKKVNDETAALGGADRISSMQAISVSQNPIPPPDNIYCFNFAVTLKGFWSDQPMFNFPGCAAIVSSWLMKVGAFFLWVSALLFDYTLDLTLNAAPLINSLQVVTAGWSIFRDMADLFFIFLLLFAAIGTIIGNSKYNAKNMIPRVIFAAILINFSLFFAEAIIDASNIIALEFYSNMGGKANLDLNAQLDTKSGQATGIAAIMLSSMKIDDLYTLSTTGSGATDQEAAVQTASQQSSGANLSAYNIALVGIGGTILFLVTSFVLFAATVLFLIRTIVLVILLTTSPIGFLSHAVPGGPIEAYGKKWWNQLWHQSFFAPIYMAMMYLAVVAIKALSSSDKLTPGSWVSMFNGNTSSISIVFTFIMIIGFMIMALMSAVSFGAVGASSMVKSGKKLKDWGISGLRMATVGAAGFAAREVIGGTAYQMANSNGMRNVVARMPGGGLIKSGLDRVASSRFGTKAGFEEAVQKRKKDRDQKAAFVGGVSEFRSKRWLENDNDYNDARDQYEKDEKGKAKAREESVIGIKTDDKGNFVSASTPFSSAKTRADARAFRLVQQQRLAELKKKGKQAVDKVARKKKYLENMDDIVGGATMQTELGADYKDTNIDSANIASFKSKLNSGTVTFAAGSKLHKIMSDITTANTALSSATTPGEIARQSTNLNNLTRKRDALEEKIFTHLDAVENIQQEENK